MLLNRKYYQDLWDKYRNIETVSSKLNDNISILSCKLITGHCRKKNSLHMNFQGRNSSLHEIGKQLFIELANNIFCHAADFPPLKKGDILRDKRNYADRRKKYYEILQIENGRYLLRDKKNSVELNKDFESVIKTFIPVMQKTQNETITRFASFFENINGKHVHDFIPTYFERKSVFIAPKTFYDLLEVKNKIPTTYFPNPREEINSHETKSIPALPDSIMYFVSRYKVCYDKILLQGKKIDTIVVYDTEETEIEQIIQDKNRFGFNLIVLTNSTEPIKCSQIPYWNWYTEETEIVNTL